MPAPYRARNDRRRSQHYFFILVTLVAATCYEPSMALGRLRPLQLTGNFGAAMHNYGVDAPLPHAVVLDASSAIGQRGSSRLARVNAAGRSRAVLSVLTTVDVSESARVRLHIVPLPGMNEPG